MRAKWQAKIDSYMKENGGLITKNDLEKLSSGLARNASW